MGAHLNKLYYSLPVCGQNLFLSIKGVERMIVCRGKLFSRILGELEQSERFSGAELENLQNEKLKRVVRQCFDNVPYYKKLFQTLRLRPSDIISYRDLEKLPFTTKEDIRKNPKAFISEKACRFLTSCSSTSGTTGKPIKVCRDLYSVIFESASIWRLYRWAGVDTKDRIATMRGTPIHPVDDMRGPFCRKDKAQNQLLLSSYHICEKTARDYYGALVDFMPAAFEAYPSSLYLLTSFFKRLGLPPFKLKAVFTSSETLWPGQRKLIEEYYSCRIFDLYGNGERVCAFGSCECGPYHVFSEYGICEFVPLDGASEKVFEPVGTSLNNMAMPLLRYSTGDKTYLFENSEPCACGRTLPIIKRVESLRADEFIVTPDGRKFEQCIWQFLEGMENIFESQIVQEAADSICINVVSDERFSDTDRERLVKKAASRLGSGFKIRVEKVARIPRTRNGKYKIIVNNVIGAAGE